MKPMRAVRAVCLVLVGLAGLQAGAAHASMLTASFDDMPAPPALDGATGLFYANGGSSLYQGIVWDDRFRVVGDQARVDTVTPGPLYGIPHSGHYFVTNEGDGTGNDGLLITTTMVLTGAWFARNEYYGFGAGADQVTINAMSGNAVLMAIVFDLPAPALAGEPGQPGFVDTSAFTGLSGISGYRIDRRELGTLSGNWVADDFTFVDARLAVPEPGGLALTLAALLALALAPALRASLPRASSGSPVRSGRRR